MSKPHSSNDNFTEKDVSVGGRCGNGGSQQSASETEHLSEKADLAHDADETWISDTGQANEVAKDDSLHRISTVIEEGIGRILDTFEEKLKYDTSKQLQVDRLYKELQEYRRDLVAQTISPFLRGIIRLHDDIGRLLSDLKENATEKLSSGHFFGHLEGLQEDVKRVLEQNGVIIYHEAHGTFDPRRQRILQIVPTDDESRNGRLAESIRPGFEYGTQILEKERVSVYKFDLSASGE